MLGGANNHWNVAEEDSKCVEYPGALYHVTARGDRREDIFFREEDRADFLSVLGEVCHRFNWVGKIGVTI